MTDAKRIVVAGMPAAGHFNPSLPIVRELARRGFEVTYYTSDDFRARVEEAGCEFRTYPAGTLGPADIAEATRNGGPVRVVARVLTATEALLPLLLSDLDTRRPDAIAFDSNAIWGRMAAARLGLPMISLMTTMLIGGKAMARLNAREWLHFLGEAIPGVPAARSAKRRVVRQFGKDAYPPAPGLPMRGDVTVFPVPRWMQSPDPRIDDGCHFVGPTIRPPREDAPLDDELAAFTDGPEPVVLVSLGTLHAGSDAFFRACFEALGGLPARILLVAGSHTDPARLGKPPANTLIRASVPQLEVLRRAAAFVTHGGMNSALEGLACGVPLVVVPQQVEQLVIGEAVAGRGAATVLRHNLSKRPVPVAELRAAVENALSGSSPREAAQAIGASLGEDGGAPAAAEAIEDYLRTRHPG
ncbi:macrolide family glycosyltransferase [Amycolatopsis sp. CA-230715]|uniref:macrolide family glycosyltransferase n=1 Tax=Amycolatopsis sp. CA-230715 TaxID=2745196 RepID=UPI001C3302EC|nr:macrolide family glycosyltransferase [Amycolatopsis sp. CA-230715]QWF82436.1 Demethyllactenocin mycarosyltransferase [Amycolatopsis sp. CA-230715]